MQLKHMLVNGKSIYFSVNHGIMEKLEPLQAFSFDGNVSFSRKLWLKHIDFYLAGTEKDTKGDKIKTSIFLTYIDQKGREMYETFTLKPGDEMNEMDCGLKEIKMKHEQ